MPNHPDIWLPFWTGIRGCITNAWEEVFGPTHPIYRVPQVERRNWRKLLEEGKWESPWVVVQIPPVSQVPSMGACNVVYQPIVTVFYISEIKPSDMGAFLEGKLSTLQQKLIEGNGSGFQLLYDFRVDVSEENPANQMLLAQNIPLMAGALTFKTQIGYTVEVY